jgi:hypothetical protein
VAREACRRQVGWQDAGISLSIAVNVSALQFQRANFSAQIHDLIESSGIKPQCLVIELTETAIMENLAEAVGILRELKALGVRIALDDFGTGYSSLSSLSTLPLDKLKIDQSFVRGIETDDASHAVIDAVIVLGNSLNCPASGDKQLDDDDRRAVGGNDDERGGARIPSWVASIGYGSSGRASSGPDTHPASGGDIRICPRPAHQPLTCQRAPTSPAAGSRPRPSRRMRSASVFGNARLK